MSFVVPVVKEGGQRMEYQLPPPPVAAAAPAGLGGAPAAPPHQVPVGVMQGTLTPHHVQDEQHRWTQYQQLWRQHVYMNGTRDNLLLLFIFVCCYMDDVGRNGSYTRKPIGFN